MVSIEPITMENALVFKDARLRALQDTPTAFGSTYAQEARLNDNDWLARADHWNGDGSAAFLALDSGKPCGIVGCFLDRDDWSCAHLVSMWVSASHRRHGVGRALVRAVLVWARTKPARDMYLTVTSNNDSAILFYQAQGFSLTGRTEPYPNDPDLFEYEMARRL